MPKRVTNPGARWSDKPKARPAHRQRNFQAVGGLDVRFLIYQRQNRADRSDFSCGIAYLLVGRQWSVAGDRSLTTGDRPPSTGLSGRGFQSERDHR